MTSLWSESIRTTGSQWCATPSFTLMSCGSDILIKFSKSPNLMIIRQLWFGHSSSTWPTDNHWDGVVWRMWDVRWILNRCLFFSCFSLFVFLFRPGSTGTKSVIRWYVFHQNIICGVNSVHRSSSLIILYHLSRISLENDNGMPPE